MTRPNEAVAFDRRTGMKVLDATRSTLSEVRPGGRGGEGRPDASAMPFAWAMITEAVSAGSWGSPGSGKAQIHHAGVASGDPVDVYTYYPGPEIPHGSVCLLAWVDARWWVALAPCEGP